MYLSTSCKCTDHGHHTDDSTANGPRGCPIVPTVFKDEERMKRELMAWAKAVAEWITARNFATARLPRV